MEKRSELICIRVTEGDKTLLESVCHLRSEDLSTFIRRTIRKELASLNYYPENVRKALGIRPLMESDDLNLPLWAEVVGSLLEVEYTEDTIRLVISSVQLVDVHLPRTLIVSAPPLLKPNETISILKIDAGYHILSHTQDTVHRDSGRSRKTMTENDIESSLRQAHNEH